MSLIDPPAGAAVGGFGSAQAGVFPIVGLWVPGGNCNQNFTVEWDQQQPFLLHEDKRDVQRARRVRSLWSLRPGQMRIYRPWAQYKKALLDYLSGKRSYVLQWQPRISFLSAFPTRSGLRDINRW